MSRSRNKLCLALLAAMTASSGAIAQDFALEEILVTAEKREASLQDTAIAVTAIDAGALERTNLEDTLDLQFSVPNLVVSGQNNSNLTLRGVGVGSIGGGADPAVGQSFNSMPINPAGEVYDLDRIEVLRGPQGTLFGRNTTGGVVNVISTKPSDEFEADLTVQVGNYGSIRTKGALNLPVTDAVSQRFAFIKVRRDGYTENVFNNTDIDGRDEVSVRSTTRFEFGDNADATLTLQYYNEESDRQSSVKTVCKPDPTIGCAVDTGDTIGYPADFPGIDIFARLGGWLRADRYGANPNPNDLRKVSIDTDPEFYSEESFAALELNFNLSDSLKLTSATAYSKTDFEQFRDWDLAAAPNAYNVTALTPALTPGSTNGALTYFRDGVLEARTDFSPVQRNARDSENISQEFRLASNYGGNFNFLTGISYIKTDSDFLGVTWLPSIHTPAAPTFFGQAVDGGGFNTLSFASSESQAIFGEAYFDVSDDLTITAGVRYTEDEKRSRAGSRGVGPVTTLAKGQGEWEEVTGKLNTNLSLSDDSSVYVTLSRGYKGGGLNIGNSVDTFDPEYVNALEVGSKNQLMDNRLQLNMAAFYYDYQDYQVGGLINGVATNFNAEEVEVKGFELESIFLATEKLQFNLNLAILDTEIVESQPLVNVSLGTSSSTEDVTGNELPHAPNMSYTIGTTYTQPVTDGMELRLRADYYWQSDFYGREFDNFEYASWSRGDVYVSLHDTDGRWDVEAFVKNVTDDDGITAGVPESNLVGLFRKVTLLDPRTFGVEVTYRWE